MAFCWETRGCDEEMQSRCPHNTPGATCPADCNFSLCSRPTRNLTMDLDLLLSPEIDHTACVKDVCQTCEFFLTHAPKVQA